MIPVLVPVCMHVASLWLCAVVDCCFSKRANTGWLFVARMLVGLVRTSLLVRGCGWLVGRWPAARGPQLSDTGYNRAVFRRSAPRVVCSSACRRRHHVADTPQSIAPRDLLAATVFLVCCVGRAKRWNPPAQLIFSFGCHRLLCQRIFLGIVFAGLAL